MSNLNSNEGHELDGVTVHTSKPDSPFVQWMQNNGAAIEPPDFPYFDRTEPDGVYEPGAVGSKPSRDQLLAHYSTQREPTRFVQYDAFVDGFDCVVVPDEDGHCIFFRETYELMSGLYAVRVLLSDKADRENAVATLRKIADLIEREGIPYRG